MLSVALTSQVVPLYPSFYAWRLSVWSLIFFALGIDLFAGQSLWWLQWWVMLGVVIYQQYHQVWPRYFVLRGTSIWWGKEEYQLERHSRIGWGFCWLKLQRGPYHRQILLLRDRLDDSNFRQLCLTIRCL